MWKRDEDARPPSVPAAVPTPHAAAPAGGSAASPPLAGDGKDRAVLGASLVIKGEISGQEDLLVQGRVEGRIDLGEHQLLVGKNGKVVADVAARIVVVEGEVRGNLVGAEQVWIRKSGNVQGDVTAPRVTLEDGCKFRGSVDMEPRPSSAADRGRRGEASNHKAAGPGPPAQPTLSTS